MKLMGEGLLGGLLRKVPHVSNNNLIYSLGLGRPKWNLVRLVHTVGLHCVVTS